MVTAPLSCRPAFLPITGIKRVFFLIGVTMTPVAILIAG